MSRFVRNSKYRHVFADRPKKEHGYENVKVTGSAWDTDLVSASAQYLAINWQVAGGGAFGILPILSSFRGSVVEGFPNKLPDIIPLARGHSGPVLDTAFSPHNDSLVASAAEDGKILLWNIESSTFDNWGTDDWVPPPDFEHSGKLIAGGGRKVGQIGFNPVAEGVLASASGDHVVRIWDIKHEQAAKIELKGHKDAVQSMAWNANGTLLATTARDRKLRIFDPRAGSEAVRTADSHGGIKGARAVWLGDRDRIITTGFSKMSDRQMMLWETAGLTQLTTETIDSSSGVIMPFFAEGNNVLFLAGKGDGNVRYYEYESDELHYLSEYKSSEPQRGMCFLPRRALDVGQNEIARGFKLTVDKVEALGFVVPRKAENFQADIFPPALSKDAALTADEFFAGKTATPKFVDLENGSATAAPTPAAATNGSAATGTSTPPAAAAKSEPKAVPTPKASTTSINERTGSLPSMKDMEIKQDDPDSDEEITEAKRRAPAGDDDFDDDEPAKPITSTKQVETPKEEVKEEAPATASLKDVSEEVPAETKSDDSAALKSEIADLKRKVSQYEDKISTLQKQLDRARSIGKELAGL